MADWICITIWLINNELNIIYKPHSHSTGIVAAVIAMDDHWDLRGNEKTLGKYSR